MATINLGRVGFVNKGAHNIATAYKVNDVVTYNSGTYACIQAHTGQLPTVTAYWQNWVANDKALDSSVVHKTGDETIAGVKTFTSSPIVPNATTATQAIAYGQAVKLTGNETITGVKTFSSNTIFNGNINFASSTKITGDFGNAAASNGTLLQTNILNDNTLIRAVPNGTASTSAFLAFGSSDVVNSHFVQMVARADSVTIDSTKTGTGLYKPLKLGIGGSYSLTLDTSGNTLVTGYGAFGYGTGTGGTVTQLTSKSTAVTLNKPCGQITMNNAALAAGAIVTFILNNSLITQSDSIYVQIVGGSASAGGSYNVWSGSTGIGNVYINFKNISANSISESVVIEFQIIKGATA